MLSTSSDIPLTVHQSPGGFLLRFSDSVFSSCSRNACVEVEAGVGEIFSLER